MAAIFLSYAREDRACAEKLARVLETAGHEVWWDRRLDGGEEFSEEIEAALEKSDAVVVAWSKESIRSRWVRDEAGVGGDRGRLVPVSIDGSLPPMGFRQFHTVDLTGWKAAKRDVRTAELLRSVERRLQGKEELPPTSRTAKLPRPARVLAKPSVIVAAMLAFVLATAGAYFYLKGDQSSSALKPTIGVLPFTSSDAELRQLGLQARDSIGHTFSQSGVPVRLMDSAPQADRYPADFLISGDLSRTAGKILATVRLDEAASQVTVFSQRLEVSREDVGNLPERIGAQLAGNLTWAYPMMLLDRRRPIPPALLADLFQGQNFAEDPFGLQAYQTVKRVASKAPDLPAAQIGLAFSTSFVLDQIPLTERAEAVTQARRSADRAIKLRPDFGDTYATWCTLHSEARLAECEDWIRAGRRADPDAPFLNAFLSHLLRSAGRSEEATELARLTYTHDLYVPTKIAWMLKVLEYVGNRDEARDLYKQGALWWPEYKGEFFRNRLSGLIDRGDFEALPALERDMDAKKLAPNYGGSVALVAALKSRSVGAAKRACTNKDDYWLSMSCMLVLSRLGDQDGAYAIASAQYSTRVGRTLAETDRIWLNDPFGFGYLEFLTSPSAAPLRRDPRYVSLAQRVGLLDYWRAGRPPDFCRKDPEPICRQLLKRR